MSRLLDRLIDPELRSHPEFQSGLARSAVWLVALLYILGGRAAGFFTIDLKLIAILFGAYLLIFVGVLFHVARDRRLHRWRRYLTMVLDISATTLTIWFTGAANSPFFLLYIWIFVSYGTRYGKEYLLAASIGSLLAYSLIVFLLGETASTLYETAFLLMSLIALPIYELSLLKKLHHEKKKAEAAVKAKSEFLATMTHEFRTPLTGIIGMLQLLRHTPLNAEQLEYTETATSSAEMLRALIGDILDFSKIDADKLVLEELPYNLESTIHSICREMAALTYDKGIELSLLIDSDLPAEVIGDRLRMRQVLNNLINNAIKFTDEGEVDVSVIEERDEDERRWLVVRVADTGIGISDEAMPHVFDSFWQEDGSISRRFGGTGLGTTIARDLVHMMGGEIHVGHNEPKGTVFTVRVPLKPASAARLINRVASLQGLHKVILVETHATSRDNLIQYCLDLGVDVHLLEYAELCEDLAPVLDCGADALLLCDSTAGLDVYRLAGRLDGFCEGRLPIVIAGYTRRRRFEQESAAIPVLAKPVSLTALASALHEALLQRKLLPSQQKTDFTETGFCAGRRILVVEDDLISARLMDTLLRQRGCEVVVAENGKEALETAGEQYFDLAFVDIHMPVMDGMEFTRNFRHGEEEGAHMPIVALTVRTDNKIREQCLEAGMDLFLTKPLDSSLLVKTLRDLLDGQTVSDISRD